MENKTSQEIYQEALKMISSMSDGQKAQMESDIDKMKLIADTNIFVTNLWYCGHISKDEFKALHASSGEHYVYLWKHADGTPFYIGSGKNYRWTSINENGRTKEFLDNVNRHDSIVYLIACGLSEKQAREYEFCCIHFLTHNGCNLSQRIWNFQRLPNQERKQKQIKRFNSLMKSTDAFYVIENLKSMLNCETGKYDIDNIHRRYAERERNYA